VKAIVVGIGNPILRDDSVGIRVVERLEGVDTAILTTTNFEVLDVIAGYDLAIIVDAIKTGDEPGRIYVLSLEDILISNTYTNTHNLTLATTLKLGYEIFPERMPKDIRIVAIEVEDAESFGEECTPKVRDAIPKAVETVRMLLNDSSKSKDFKIEPCSTRS